MKKEVNALILASAILFIITTLSISSSSESHKISNKILEKLNQKEKIRVIVVFENETRFSKIFGFFEEKSNKEKIISLLGKESESRIKHSFENSVVMLVSQNELKKLESASEIKKIE